MTVMPAPNSPWTRYAVPSRVRTTTRRRSRSMVQYSGMPAWAYLLTLGDAVVLGVGRADHFHHQIGAPPVGPDAVGVLGLQIEDVRLSELPRP